MKDKQFYKTIDRLLKKQTQINDDLAKAVRNPSSTSEDIKKLMNRSDELILELKDLAFESGISPEIFKEFE